MLSKVKIGAIGFVLLLVNALSLNAQDLTVSGKVTTSDGEPLPGVNVSIESTNSGTTTDADGDYEISAEADATIVFSFVGFKSQEIKIDDREVIDVKLTESTESLDEVLVMGYTEQSKEESSSSVVQVDSDDINDVTTNSATDALQGKLSGVYVTSSSGEPGETSEVRVRGSGSISAGGDPLYVVDGVIGGTYDPNDVESINVLKDASATSLYGSRAANGVVVVETKSGRSGDTQINVSSTLGWNERSNGNFEIMDSQELYNYHQQIDNPNLEGEYQEINTDWQELAFRTGMTNKYEASASGGDDETTFYVSGNYYKEEGTLVATNYERFGGRANIEHQFRDDFSINAQLSGRYSTDDNNPTGALYESYTNMPWDEPYNEDDELKTGKENDWIGRDQVNFLYPLQYNFNNSSNKEVTANVRAEYDILDWLYATSTNRVTYSTSRAESFSDPRTSAGSTNDGELENTYSQSSSFLSSNLLNFSQAYGDHTLNGVLGFEYEFNYADGMGGTGVGIFSGLEILDVSAEAFSIGGYKSDSEFLSGLSQVTYDYDDTYYLKGSFRRDGSSRFGQNNQYGNFYSFGGSWILSNEPFMDSYDWLSNLKLRASYGTTGNAEIGNYLASGLYDYSVQYSGDPGSQPERIENPDLTWEVAKMANIGLEVGLWERANLTIDVYRKTNDDLLQNVTLPGTSGIESITQNIGSVRNNGIELGLSSTNIEGEFSWTTDFNIAFNNNEVLSLNEGEDISNGNQRIMEGHDLRTWYMRDWAGVDSENGDPLWIKQETDEDGNVVSEETTSNYSEASLMSVGSASPDFSGGFGNTLQYKGFRLNAFFNFVYGNKIYHSARQLFDSDGAYVAYNAMVLENDWSRWEESGDDATHPKPEFGGNNNSNRPSSRYLEDGSYLRLRNVTMSYNLPNQLTSGLGVRSARIFVKGDNLMTFTSFSGMDPEVGLSGDAGTKYPISKKYLIGIELGL